MHKIINDNAEGFIVVPYWPTQAWFPVFKKKKKKIFFLK